MLGAARRHSQLDELHVSLRAMAHLYEQVRARLIEAISAGEWRAGEAIPTEGELAATFEVAIGTVRKAVDSLVAGQVLVRRQGKGTFVTAHDGRRLMFHFFHIVGRDGAKAYPEVRTLAFRRDRATAEEAAALAVAPLDKVIRVRNLLSLGGEPAIVDDITLPAELFPGLNEKIFRARDNTSTTFTRAATASTCCAPTSGCARCSPRATWRSSCAWLPERRSSRFAAWRSPSASGRWSCACRA